MLCVTSSHKSTFYTSESVCLKQIEANFDHMMDHTVHRYQDSCVSLVRQRVDRVKHIADKTEANLDLGFAWDTDNRV